MVPIYSCHALFFTYIVGNSIGNNVITKVPSHAYDMPSLLIGCPFFSKQLARDDMMCEAFEAQKEDGKFAHDAFALEGPMTLEPGCLVRAYCLYVCCNHRFIM